MPRGWETGDNDYTPFVEYMLGVILKCYDELTERTSALSVRGSNEKTIRQYFQSIEEPVSKIEILEANPMMSQKTLERILQKMQKEHSIEKVGAAAPRVTSVSCARFRCDPPGMRGLLID